MPSISRRLSLDHASLSCQFALFHLTLLALLLQCVASAIARDRHRLDVALGGQGDSVAGHSLLSAAPHHFALLVDQPIFGGIGAIEHSIVGAALGSGAVGVDVEELHTAGVRTCVVHRLPALVLGFDAEVVAGRFALLAGKRIVDAVVAAVRITAIRSLGKEVLLSRVTATARGVRGGYHKDRIAITSRRVGHQSGQLCSLGLLALCRVFNNSSHNKCVHSLFASIEHKTTSRLKANSATLYNRADIIDSMVGVK